MPKRRLLVTCALPYANLFLHIGHMLEKVQADVWVRFQRMQGHEVHYVCADDTHGTPVMLRADAEGISPEKLIARVYQEHVRDLQGFLISHDNFHTTHGPETRQYAEFIYEKLASEGLIATRDVEQFYDPVKEMFLPDRYVKGECPRCGAKDQYGDSCEVCGATYSPTELKNPYSAISGAKPVRRLSKHYFFKLGEKAEFLKKWTRSGTLQAEVANKMDEWLDAGLNDWDISRDAPYFGFEIPGAPGKYFYVWLDAPIGYFGSFKNYCERTGIDPTPFLNEGHGTELIHFIGKDILYFHSLFWPAMLHAAGFRTPTRIYAHGFLTVDGEKMSKSRGTFITAESWIKYLDVESLRYYFAAKLGPGVDDVDLNLDDFIARVNSDLVGKYVNIASRCAGFVSKRFAGKLAAKLGNTALLDEMRAAAEPIAALYEGRECSKAVREIMRLADLANQYVDEKKPWELAKQAGKDAELHQVCTDGINAFRLLTLYLKPILPKVAQAVEAFLAIEPLAWKDAATPLLSHEIKPYKHLMARVDPKAIEQLLEANKQSLKPDAPAVVPGVTPVAETVSIDDFSRIDLRVAKILKAEAVEDSDKLLKLTVDIGVGERTIFAGIKNDYDPAQLEGRLTVIVANLAPRKMRFGESQGMVLAAGDGNGVYVLAPDSGATPGMRVK